MNAREKLHGGLFRLYHTYIARHRPDPRTQLAIYLRQPIGKIFKKCYEQFQICVWTGELDGFVTSHVDTYLRCVNNLAENGVKIKRRDKTCWDYSSNTKGTNVRRLFEIPPVGRVLWLS